MTRTLLAIILSEYIQLFSFFAALYGYGYLVVGLRSVLVYFLPILAKPAVPGLR